MLILVLGVVPAACGGGGHGSAVPSAAAPSPAQTGSTQSGGRGAASLTIKIPAGATTQANHRSPKYVSPSTTQLLVNVKQGGTSISGYPQTIALTSGSPNCTVVSGATQCLVQLGLSPGTYTADFTLEDSAGTKLSLSDAVPISVTLGETTNVPIVLAGIPVSVSAVSASPVVTGTAATGLVLAGAGPHQIAINALDADGNIIVGTGQPSYTASATGSLALTVKTPDATMPNMLTVTPPVTQSSATATLTFHGSYPSGTDGCAQSGAVCTTSATTFSATPLLAIGYSGYVGLVIPGQTTPVYSITANVSYTVGVKFDAEGNLFVGSSPPGTTGYVSEYAPPYNEAVPTATVTNTENLTETNAIALDPSGNLYVASENEGNVTEYAAGTLTSMRVLTAAVGPIDICTDPSGNLFVLNAGTAGNIQEFGPTGTTVTASYAIEDPNHITCDRSGNAYASQYAYISGSYATAVIGFGPSLATQFALNQVYGPNGVSGTDDGRVYVMNSGQAQTNVSRYEAGATTPDEVIPLTIEEPSEVVTDSSGNVWLADHYSDTVYYYPAGSSTSTYQIPETTPARAFGGMDISL
jgi:sugar lactone lactonase YvrE